MSIQDFIYQTQNHNRMLMIWFVVVPAVVYLYGRIHTRRAGTKSPHKYVYSLLVYATCIPGVFSSVLTLYTLLFIRANLLQVNALVYFLPIFSMLVTLLLMRKQVDLKQVPGFDRVFGLIIMLAVVFMVLFLLVNTRIFLFFGGSFLWLALLGIFLFGILMAGWHKLKKK